MVITLSIPDSTLANVIFSGLVSGIGHWCSEAKITGRKRGITSGALSDPDYERYFRPLQNGALVVKESETKKSYVIDCQSIAKALIVMGEKYPHHLKSILADDTDAETGDVLIQCAAFGGITYE